MNALPQVLIIDLTSQVTEVIARTLREMGIRSMIESPAQARKLLEQHRVRAIILSGGAASVYDDGAPQPPEEVFTALDPEGKPVPVLGICYGLQFLAHKLGGTVEPIQGIREFGKAQLEVLVEHLLFLNVPRISTVWASHGDSVTNLPAGFVAIAQNALGGIAAVADDSRRIYGVQFHPEVPESEHGKTMLQNFVFLIAGCERDWEPTDLAEEITNEVEAALDGRNAVFGVSGGLDSTTLAAMLGKRLSSQITFMALDAGNWRAYERDELTTNIAHAGVGLEIVDATSRFSSLFSNTIDAQTKRRRYTAQYIWEFQQVANRVGAPCVIQGSLAPDFIESGAAGAELIKSHHNVGGDWGGMVQLHPFRNLFKHEVREIAKSLGLPACVYARQPFPGPGLFIRIVNVPVTAELLALVAWADQRVRDILEKHGFFDQISQLVVAYLGLNSVGVKGDGRAYGGCIGVRAVKTIDFMTASGIRLASEIKDEIEAVLAQHRSVVGVLYDEMNKPPRTIEWE